ncbi:hypothetical protein ABFS83_06G151900 [Erythranthe nasuta]
MKNGNETLAATSSTSYLSVQVHLLLTSLYKKILEIQFGIHTVFNPCGFCHHAGENYERLFWENGIFVRRPTLTSIQSSIGLVISADILVSTPQVLLGVTLKMPMTMTQFLNSILNKEDWPTEYDDFLMGELDRLCTLFASLADGEFFDTMVVETAQIFNQCYELDIPLLTIGMRMTCMSLPNLMRNPYHWTLCTPRASLVCIISRDGMNCTPGCSPRFSGVKSSQIESKKKTGPTRNLGSKF